MESTAVTGRTLVGSVAVSPMSPAEQPAASRSVSPSRSLSGSSAATLTDQLEAFEPAYTTFFTLFLENIDIVIPTNEANELVQKQKNVEAWWYSQY